MKKKALLIGNSRNLEGTSKDMLDFQMFLMSEQGGAWEQDEIRALIDTPISQLKCVIDEVKQESYDYVIVYFTGHGGCRNETIMEVNPQNECIMESLLVGLSPKQLNILDCCRSWIPGNVPIDEDHSCAPSDIRAEIKKEYENLIEAAAEQQVRIYSCREGESSYPFRGGKGSVYSQCFLESAKALLKKQDVVSVYDCHKNAALETMRIIQGNNLTQTPDIIPAKCLSALELPISFNPSCLKV